MKTFVKIFLLVPFSLFMREECKGQVQLSTSSIYVPSNETGRSIFGFSVSGKYFYARHANAGVSVRYVPNLSLFTSTVHTEYIFNMDHALRPYVGIEGGLYRRANNSNSETNVSAFGGGVKVGLQYAITPSFGVDAGFTQHISEPAYYRYVSESRMVNLGLYVNL